MDKEKALRKIREICLNTPEGSSLEDMDGALNEILDICEECI